MHVDSFVSAAIKGLRDNPANSDVPEDFWKKLAIELSDSQWYYDGTSRPPNYEEAKKFAEQIIKDWRKAQ